MSEFDTPLFEQLMGEAVRLHGKQQYEAALTLSTQAYDMAPDNSFEKGRAARDNGARCDRLGRSDEASAWAEEAYAVHDGLVQSMEHPTREAYRERSVSAMYVGVSGLRKVMRARREGQAVDTTTPLEAMRQAWSDLKAAKTQAQGVNQNVDQYEVNAARRVSMAESLLGSSKSGLAIGARAIGLAFWSESPRLDTSNPNMTRGKRGKAKVKALLGGLSAVGVGLLAATQTDRGMQLATALADKTL